MAGSMLLEQIHRSGYSERVDHLLEKFLVILSNSIVSHWQLSALRRLIGNNARYYEKVLELRNLADNQFMNYILILKLTLTF